MRRRSIDDQDSNDHISQATLNTYNVIEDYNTTASLSRYDDGSGDYDSTANRITTNALAGGGAYGYTGNVADIKIIPQTYLDNNNVLEFLNGTTWSSIMTNKFKWIKTNQAPSGVRKPYNYNQYAASFSTGPLSGSRVYTKTGYTVVLPNPGAGDDLAAFLGLWYAIDQGTVTSLKIPIDLITSDSKFANNETYITNERVSIDIAGTLIDTTTDGDGLAAVQEDGWWTRSNNRTNLWRNYYIGGGNNVYISETNSVNGLVALPDFSGIEFTFGVTVPQRADNRVLQAFARLPFSMTGFSNIASRNNNSYLSNSQVNYINGNNWDFKYWEKYGNQYFTPYKLMTSNHAHGTFYGDTYLKFKMLA